MAWEVKASCIKLTSRMHGQSYRSCCPFSLHDFPTEHADSHVVLKLTLSAFALSAKVFCGSAEEVTFNLDRRLLPESETAAAHMQAASSNEKWHAAATASTAPLVGMHGRKGLATVRSYSCVKIFRNRGLLVLQLCLARLLFGLLASFPLAEVLLLWDASDKLLKFPSSCPWMDPSRKCVRIKIFCCCFEKICSYGSSLNTKFARAPPCYACLKSKLYPV